MKKLLFFIFIVSIITSQSTFKKIEPFLWEIDLSNLIIRVDKTYSKNQLNRVIRNSHASYNRILNSNSYYKVKLENQHLSFTIYQKAIERLKKNRAVLDIIPIFLINDKTNEETFRQSNVESNYKFVSDSLFSAIYSLKDNFISVIEQEFRNKSDKVFNINLEFDIKKAESKNIRIKASNIPKKYHKGIKRIAQNQFWGNKSIVAKVNFTFYLFREIRK